MSSTDVNMPSPASKALKEGWSQSLNLKPVTDLFDRSYVINIGMALVLLMAALLRFHGSNWDEGHHLHPDERFLSTVTNDLQWPESFANYFNPDVSTLSPYSNPNMGLYVYGTL